MIAISYRREDSLPIAGRLYDRLQAKFGKKNVFMDFDSIPPGADFRQHIKQMIERSNLVIAIIGPRWLGEQPDASRRIDNPADFVRLEIGYALEAGIPVIPLLINTTEMPKPEMLPPDIQELAFRHALPLDSGMDFHSHTDRLIAGISKAADAARKRRRLGLALVAGGKAVVRRAAVEVSAARKGFRDAGLAVSGVGKAMSRGVAVGLGAAKELRRATTVMLLAVSKETLRGTAVTVILAALVAACIWYFAIRSPPEKIVQQPTPSTQPSQPPPIAGSPSPDTSVEVAGGQTVHMKGVRVNLPTGVSGETWALSDYVSVSVDKDGRAYSDKNEMTYDQLFTALKKVYAENPDAKVLVRGDAETVHGNIIRVLDILRAAGFNKIAFEIKSEATKAFPAPKGSETIAVMGIPVDLPNIRPPPPNQPKDFVSIRVAAGPVYYVDNVPMQDDQEVMRRLQQMYNAKPDLKVSISAEMMAIHGDIISILDHVRAVGIKKVGYQIRAAQNAGAPGTMSISGAKALAPDFSAVTKEQPYVNGLGMKFVPVPVPATKVLFSVWETRVKDFQAFAEATKRDWPKPTFQQTDYHPAVMVSWDDATAFCGWLTERERNVGQITANQAYRLPTDLEWSAAVGLETESGTTPKERNMKVRGVFPWGTQWPPPRGAGNYDPSLKADDFEWTSPVGIFGANSFGIYDLGGNVWEWCEDWFDAEKKKRTWRGSSWGGRDPMSSHSSFRAYNPPDHRSPNCGFRCVLSESTTDKKSSGIAAPALGSPSGTGAQTLTKVYVKKYGFSVLLPNEFFPDAAAQLADPNTDRLVSVNGCFGVGFTVLRVPLKKAYESSVTEFRKEANHRTIDYKIAKETWFVVSGDSPTTGYYTKGVKRGEEVVVMELEYTGAECNISDATLTEMSRKFDGK